jgi:hypothetical protein
MPLQQLKEIAKKYDGRVASLLSLGGDSIQGKGDVAQLLTLARDMAIYQFDYSNIAEDEGLERAFKEPLAKINAQLKSQ